MLISYIASLLFIDFYNIHHYEPETIGIFYSYVDMPAWIALICVRTYLKMGVFDSPHLNWYMYASLLHSSAASAHLRALSARRRDCDGFFIVTMTLYRWSSQSLRIIAIVFTITHAHSLPHLLPW